jgi:ABC-type antimicrobial peptide transport system permease subunit
VDPGQTIYHSATLQALVSASLGSRRFHLGLVGSFSLLALALSTLGVYGLVSYSTQQRTGEIGLRLALGAEARQIVGLVVGEGLRLALPGVAVGVLAAFALTRFLAGMLYGVSAHDPATFGQLAVLMLAVAAVAAYLPARLALRRDPLSALRAE